jgi:hypothetical protein
LTGSIPEPTTLYGWPRWFDYMENQIVWVGCIALAAVAVVGLFLTSVLILEKEEREAVTGLPPTFTNPGGIHAEMDVNSAAGATLNDISYEPVSLAKDTDGMGSLTRIGPSYELSAPSLALPDQFTVRGQAPILEAKRVVRGTYDVLARWPDEKGVEVGVMTVEVSGSNVVGTVVLALRDVSFSVVDRQGRPLSGARVNISPRLVRDEDMHLTPDTVFTLLRLPDGRAYDFTVEWTSGFGTTAKAIVCETPAGLQARGSITVPVDDVSIKVVDLEGRPVAEATIKLAGKDVGSTDSQGIIIVGQVPLDNDYTITVTREGMEIGSDRVRFTASRTSATIQAGIYDITVLVKGAAGQPIQGALVELIKDGTTIARAATDVSGTAVFTKAIGEDYEVRASYGQFRAETGLPRGMRNKQITLDIYTLLLGVPVNFPTFLILTIGFILLIIVVVVAVSEYINWRGRRLGIYPPPMK